MPELPEVEIAARALRAAAEGRTIVRVRLIHPSLRARVAPARLRSLSGARVTRVERRGKHQLLHLADGRVVHAHFRMSGDWEVDTTSAPAPRYGRAVVELDDGTRVWLVDPRALATIQIRDDGGALDLGLGPDATDAALRAETLLTALKRKRGAIKPALLDQRVLAGVGNIYAAEALWRARIDPRAGAASLERADVARLVSAIRSVMRGALGGAFRFAVYDREGKPCRRCRTPIARIVQAGRSSYFCPSCQRPKSATGRGISRVLRAGRP